ncbi:hypothetical protein ACJMK2_035911 [Sinanodonta woodiana]|uniref:2'-phosphotransferase n=1 Tax=Sinanodonta woodiana TaxID=1069815 RepID=A0ABD3WFI9_SINWO
MNYNYDQSIYNHMSRGRGRGYSWDMDSFSFPHQRNSQNQRFMNHMNHNYGTEMRNLSHRKQDPWQSYPNQGYMSNMPCRMSAPSKGQQDIVRLSKTLAFLLRHGAENLGFYFMPGGFLYVDELLRYHKPLKGFTLEQIKELVRTNDKQRFYLQEDDEGRLMIRANQGHTTVVEGLDLSPVSDSSEVEMVLHGTYYQAWDQIQNTGLSRMNRNHIHFAAGMPGESGVISGMRKSCEVVIEIDLEKALKARIPFFRSANNVILSPGNDEGFIPPIFFKRVFDRHSGEELMPLDFLRSNSSSSQNTSLPSVQGAAEGWSPIDSLKRMREESKDGPRSKKARLEKEGLSSKSDTKQYEKGITTSGKLHNKTDKEKAKQMQSNDGTEDRGKSRSDRDEKKDASKSQNENEKKMSKWRKVKDEKEEIALSHDAKGKERTVQVIIKDEKEVGETSNYKSGKGKGERIKFQITARR